MKQRRKGFIALLLMLLMLWSPVMEVWAQTYTVEKVADTGSSSHYRVTLNGNEVKGSQLPIYGSAGTYRDSFTFYALPGDVIGCTEDPDTTTRDKDDDMSGDAVTGTGSATWNTTAHTLTLPETTDLWTDATKKGWKVVVTHRTDSGLADTGELDDIRITPADVIKIKYVNKGSRTGDVADSENKNITCVPYQTATSVAAASYSIIGLSNVGTNSFDGWYQDEGLTTSLTGINADYDTSVATTSTKITTSGGSAAGTQLPVDTTGTIPMVTIYAKWTDSSAPTVPTGPAIIPGPAAPTGPAITPGPVTLEEEKKPAVVSFLPGDGFGSMGQLTAENDFIILPECTFTPPEGWIFAGWGNGMYQPGEKYYVSSDTNLTAMWKINESFEYDISDLYISLGSIKSRRELDAKILKETGIRYNENGDVDGDRSYYRERSKIESDKCSITYEDGIYLNKVSRFTAHLSYTGLYNRTLEKDVIIHVNKYKISFGKGNQITIKTKKLSRARKSFESKLLSSLSIEETSFVGKKKTNVVKKFKLGKSKAAETTAAKIIKGNVWYSTKKNLDKAGTHGFTLYADLGRRGLELTASGRATVKQIVDQELIFTPEETRIPRKKHDVYKLHIQGIKTRASYVSSKKKVCVVDKHGNLKVKRKGKAVITVTAKAGETATRVYRKAKIQISATVKKDGHEWALYLKK